MPDKIEMRMSQMQMGKKDKKIRMPDGSMMTQEEIDEKFGETTPMMNMPKKKIKKMPMMTTGKRG